MLKIPKKFNCYRIPHWISGNMGDDQNGCFRIPVRKMIIVASSGEGWDHVSVSIIDRCPTWEEMEFVKRELFSPEDTVMQLHVPVQDHINCHQYCLHLWRPHNQEIPLPPKEFVA